MTDRKRIPTPLSHRWRRFRYSLMPFFTFGLLLALTLWMWGRHTVGGNAVGAVEAVRVDVAAATSGTLAQLEGAQYSLFDSVSKGQIVGRLDDTALNLAIDVAEAELARISKEIDASEAAVLIDVAQLKQNDLEHRTRLAWEYERRRVIFFERKVDLERERMRFEGLEAQMKIVKPLADGKLFSQLAMEELRTLRSEALARMTELQTSIAEDEIQRERAKQLFQRYPKIDIPEVSRVLAPLQSAVKSQEIAIKEIEHRISQLNLVAPISGTIAAVYCWPGQNVQAGDPVVTVAADHGRYIVSYVRQSQGIKPYVGDLVLIHSREARGAQPLQTPIDRVGPQFELIPENQLRDPSILEWGLPIRISVPQGLDVRPGEIVDITFPPK